jgi:hypothetical protein
MTIQLRIHGASRTRKNSCDALDAGVLQQKGTGGELVARRVIQLVDGRLVAASMT